MSRNHPAHGNAPHLKLNVLYADDDLPLPADFVPLRLVMLPGGNALELSKPEVVVGRHSACDVRLVQADVSRRHCRLLFKAGRWWIEDFGSLNGIYVNEAPVQSRSLQTGDCVRVGQFKFVVQPIANSEGIAPAGDVLRSIAITLTPPAPEQRKAS